MSQSLSRFSEEVVTLFPHIMRSTFRLQTDALGRGTMTLPQYICLDLLHIQGSLKMKDIARSLHVTLPAATGLINRLHAVGLVRRSYDSGDRRIIKISLTEKGKKSIKGVRARRRKIIEKVFENLSDAERSQYLNILRKVKKGLDERKKKN